MPNLRALFVPLGLFGLLLLALNWSLMAYGRKLFRLPARIAPEHSRFTSAD